MKKFLSAAVFVLCTAGASFAWPQCNGNWIQVPAGTSSANGAVVTEGGQTFQCQPVAPPTTPSTSSNSSNSASNASSNSSSQSNSSSNSSSKATGGNASAVGLGGAGLALAASRLLVSATAPWLALALMGASGLAALMSADDEPLRTFRKALLDAASKQTDEDVRRAYLGG